MPKQRCQQIQGTGGGAPAGTRPQQKRNWSALAIPFIGGGVWIKAKVCPAQEGQSTGKSQGATSLQHLCVLPPPPLLVPPASGSPVHLKTPCLGLEGALFSIHRSSLECPPWCSLTDAPSTAANVVGDCSVLQNLHQRGGTHRIANRSCPQGWGHESSRGQH